MAADRAPRGCTRDEIVSQLAALGVQRDGVLLVHTSYRAVRPVDGGPEALIAALRAALGPEGTLVMPSMAADDDAPFDPRTSDADPSLGIVASMFWQTPGVQRSTHPFAFAAVGRHAREIVQGPLPLPPHGPES